MTIADFPHPRDKVIILKRIPVFAECTEKQLLLIADRTRLVEYKKGEHVYREGDRAEAFHIVVAGRLRVFTRVGDEEKTFTVLHNDDSFGEISLLTGETHSASVEALNDTLVLQLQKEDFEDVINRIPTLVLHLSRLLSKRLRMRELGGEYAEGTIVAIYSAARGVGRTLFALTLATLLKRESRHEVIVVDLNPVGTERERWYRGLRPNPVPLPSLPGLRRRVKLEGALLDHPLGFDVFTASEVFTDADGDDFIAPLFSELTKRYAYILIDLPVELDAPVLKALTQSDLIYLLTDQHQDNVTRTKALMHQLQDLVTLGEKQLHVVVSLLGGIGVWLKPAAISAQLETPVAATLPRVASGPDQLRPEQLERLVGERRSTYVTSVRRMARELNRSLIGLALGSGAALGLAHIGVLKVLERERIPIDIVAGASIGSLVAGLWASGHTADDLEKMALRFKNPWDIRKLFIFDVGIPMFSIVTGVGIGLLVGSLIGFWSGLLFGFIACVGVGVVLGPLAGGPIQGAQLMAKLERDFNGKRFEDTQIPLRIVASNPMEREEVVFDSGSIAEAVRASVAIPGIFKPVLRQGKICLDGGVVNPVPVSVVKQAGAHRVIAVNVFPTTIELTAHLADASRRRAEREARLASRSFFIRFGAWLGQEIHRSVSPLIFDVIMRSMQSMEYQIAEVACQEADLTLRPTVPGSHWLEFFAPEKFIRRGEEVAMRHLPELKRLSGLTERDIDNG